jgi:hypothetical protein
LAPIKAKDLEIKPNSLGHLHLKSVVDDKAYVAWLQDLRWKDIMASRRIYVAVGDAVSRQPPVIHHSVFDRMSKAPSRYNPPNLRKLGDNYRILGVDEASDP